MDNETPGLQQIPHLQEVPLTSPPQRRNKKRLVILVLAFLAVLGGAATIWLFSKDDAPKITNFAECKAAGNPIMESFPEQCRADGQTFVNTDQSADQSHNEEHEGETAPVDEPASWLLYESTSFSIRIPDGWNLVRPGGQNENEASENLHGFSYDEQLSYQSGTKATVVRSYAGFDGSPPFSLVVPGAYYDQIVKKGEKQGEVKTKAGFVAEKYYFVQEKEPEGIDYAKGSKVYNYYFGAQGKYIQVEHVSTLGSPDLHEFVEKMIAPLPSNS